MRQVMCWMSFVDHITVFQTSMSQGRLLIFPNLDSLHLASSWHLSLKTNPFYCWLLSAIKHSLLWVEMCPPKNTLVSHITPECILIWKSSLCRSKKVKMRLLWRTLTQNIWCPYKWGKFRHRTQEDKKHHVTVRAEIEAILL